MTHSSELLTSTGPEQQVDPNLSYIIPGKEEEYLALRETIAGLFDDDVDAIVQMMTGEDFRVGLVTAPHGTGKSGIVLPRVVKRLQESGNQILLNAAMNYWPNNLEQELQAAKKIQGLPPFPKPFLVEDGVGLPYPSQSIEDRETNLQRLDIFEEIGRLFPRYLSGCLFFLSGSANEANRESAVSKYLLAFSTRANLRVLQHKIENPYVPKGSLIPYARCFADGDSLVSLLEALQYPTLEFLQEMLTNRDNVKAKLETHGFGWDRVRHVHAEDRVDVAQFFGLPPESIYGSDVRVD